MDTPINEEVAEESVDALATTFDELTLEPFIREALKKLEFSIPTPVQAASIPIALEGKDLVAQAQTGSGKTLAFVIPLLTKLRLAKIDANSKATYGLIVAPTRELANQIMAVIHSLTDEVKPVLVIGGADMAKQISGLKKDGRIVVGTPGRILDLMRQRALSLKECRYFVLDEADEMLSMGFLEDVRSILSRLPDERQGMFVSATISPRVEMLANSFLSKPANICVDAPKTDLPLIEHLYCEVGSELMSKPAALCDIIESLRPRSAIIFCNTKSDTQLVEALLRRRGFDARRINSDLTQSQRDRIMKKIRAEDLQFLVATDIAARGLDIDQIDLVVNYAIHEQPEIYVHRTGRTGRAGRSGKAISLVAARDFGAFHYLKKVLGAEFKKFPLPTDDDLCDARLSHLHEILRETHIELQDRDLIVAKKLLKEMGGIEDPSEDFETIIAKLCRFAVEHTVAEEAKSLDEELDAKEEERPAKRSRRDEKEPRGKRERGDKSARGEKRERGARSSDQKRSNDSRDKKEHGRSADRSSKKPDGERSSRDDKKRSNPPKEQPDELRLYIGQGALHGMTADEFTNLAVRFGELKKEDLRNLTIREHYGFIDLHEKPAKQLIKNLNGIEYNEQPLVVELATRLSSKRPRRGPRRPRN